MRKVTVNGETYEMCPLCVEDIVPGALVRGSYVRKAYRILMCDDGDWIMRNLRHPDLVDVATTEWLLENCDHLIPLR